MTIQLEYVFGINRISESLNVISVFVCFINGPLIAEPINLVEIPHQFADDPHTPGDLSNGRVLFFQTLDAEKPALPQHSVSNVQNNYISLFDVLWRCVLNMTVNYFNSFRCLGHPSQPECVALSY